MKRTSNIGHDLALRTVKLLNVAIMTLIFSFYWHTFLNDTLPRPYYWRGNAFVVFLFLLIYFEIGRTYSAFLISYQRFFELVYSQFLAVLETDIIMYIIMFLLSRHHPWVHMFVYMLLTQVAFSVAWAFLSHLWYFKAFPAKKSIVVWDMRSGLDNLVNSYGLDKKFEIVGNYPVEECIDNLSLLDDIEVVFLAGIHSHDRNIIIKYCVEHDVTAFIIPRVGDILMSGAKRMHMFHLPMMRLQRYSPSPEYLFFKRVFDIILSVLALILVSPIMLVTAIAIKATDGGPVFYRQCRLTKDGKKFNVLKFRSMRVDAEKDGVARLSTGDNDDRITPVGRKIRACRIDELPQFINILCGDMSIVGPRPERPEIAAEYEQEMPEFHLRLQAKCGLTGYAQVYGKYNTTPYDKLEMDLMYIAHPSLAEDFMICLATIKILFMKDSTEGIAEGQTTASDNKQDAGE